MCQPVLQTHDALRGCHNCHPPTHLPSPPPPRPPFLRPATGRHASPRTLHAPPTAVNTAIGTDRGAEELTAVHYVSAAPRFIFRNSFNKFMVANEKADVEADRGIYRR